jgi:hypothetical protein
MTWVPLHHWAGSSLVVRIMQRTGVPIREVDGAHYVPLWAKLICAATDGSDVSYPAIRDDALAYCARHPEAGDALATLLGDVEMTSAEKLHVIAMITTEG